MNVNTNIKSAESTAITAAIDFGIQSVFVTGIIGQECAWEIEAYGVDTRNEVHNFATREEVENFVREQYIEIFVRNSLTCKVFQNGEQI